MTKKAEGPRIQMIPIEQARLTQVEMVDIFVRNGGVWPFGAKIAVWRADQVRPTRPKRRSRGRSYPRKEGTP